jgi:hypothetical protein
MCDANGIVSYNNLNAESFTIAPPKKNKDGKLMISMKFKGINPNGYETPYLRAPFGLSRYEKDGNITWSVPLVGEAKDPETQEEVTQFFATLEAIDQVFLNYGVENGAVMFPVKGKAPSKELIESKYSPLVKVRPDGSRFFTLKFADLGNSKPYHLKEREDRVATLTERISEENEDEDDRNAIRDLLTERGLLAEDGTVTIPDDEFPNVLFYRPDGSEVMIFSYDDLAEAMPEKKSCFGRYIFTLRPWVTNVGFGLKPTIMQMEVEEPPRGKPKFNAFSKKPSSATEETADSDTEATE